jgi:hypothetical protein
MGQRTVSPDRDRLAFARHLIDIGCRPPENAKPPLLPRRRKLVLVMVDVALVVSGEAWLVSSAPLADM